MKIIFCSVENGVISIGFRKMASFVKAIHSDVVVCYVTPSNMYSRIDAIVNFGNTNSDLPQKDIKLIAEYLSKAEMLCFSSMTPFAKLTKKIVKSIREINQNIYIVWGGIHPSVYPEDAIKHVDAICVGEGEYSFKEFVLAYTNSKDYLKTSNFWFNKKNKIIKNGFRKLQQPGDMENFPYPFMRKMNLFIRKN